MRTARGIIGIVLCGSIGLGCGSGEPSPAIKRETYIDTYVELLQVAAEAPDSAAATDSARAVLRRRDVTEADLSEFALRHADDPAYMASVWGEIENRLRERPPRPDSADGSPE